MATEHVCALLSNKSLKCWGDDTWGELGNGVSHKAVNPTPVEVTEITNAIAVSAGSNDSCALRSGGVADCWGLDKEGELGNGTVSESPYPTPGSVEGITSATSIAAGNGQTCALISGGSIECWGYNDNGRLGNGTTKSSSTPVTVTGIG
jgi:alpha-tubulin suppressor-like RCC1 family protein